MLNNANRLKASWLPASFFLLALAAISGFAQQEFTFTTTAANITASMARIDRIGLANNPNAIIVATPLYDPIKTTQRSLGVWYYNNQWFFFNTDHSPMREGLSFRLQVFLSPSDNEFVHIISSQNLAGGFSVINHPLTDNKPNAAVKILQNHAPDIRSPNKLNADEAQAVYDTPTGKWYIQNVNGNPLSSYTAYNVVISPGATPINTNIRVEKGGLKTANPGLPVPTPNTGNAGGDLSGTYPDPTVQKLLGRPLSSVAPTVGQLLRWNGTQWEPANNNAGTGGFRTFFKSGSASPNGEFSGSQNFNATNLAHTIILDKRSRLMISATIGIWKKFCAICGPATAAISVRVNNQEVIWGPSSTDIATGGFGSGVISNYMVDLDPGTHKIEIWVFKRNGSSDFAISQNYSSIMVIPIE